MVKISTILFMLGIFGLIIGMAFLVISFDKSQNVHKNVDCFDEHGSKIIGQTCISESNETQELAIVTGVISFAILLMSYAARVMVD